MLKQIRSKQQSLGLMMIALMLTWQIGQPLQAATFYWDADANATGNSTAGTNLGGTGAWDTTTANWWDGTAVTDQAWPNTNADQAIFSGAFPSLGIPAASTITLSSGIIANRLSFFRSGYTLTGGTLTLDGTTPTLHANLGESATINSQILGTAGLTKTGGGAIRLANAANSYMGVTTISNGTLIIGSSGALGSDTSTITVGSAASSAALLLAGNTGAANYSTGFTLSRNLSISGSGGGGGATTAAINGAALVSVGSNTLGGVLTTVPGALANLPNTGLTSAFGLLTLGNIAIGGTAITNFSTFGSTGSIGSYAITGVMTGTGSIQKAGGGTLVLASTDATGFSGTFRLSAGSVRISSAAVLGSNAGTTTSGTLDMNGGILEVRSDTGLAIGKTVYERVSSTLFADHGIGGTAINGTHTFGSHSFEDGQTMTLNGRNGYGITFTTAPVNGGNGNSVITNNLTGLLTFTGAFWSNTENTGARTMTVNGTGNTLISGNFTASSVAFDHNLTKNGIGTVTITSTGSTLDGNVNINNGSLVITDFRSITNNAGTINIGSNASNTGLTSSNNNGAGTLTIGTATAATAGGLTTSKVINLAGTTNGATINASQAGANPVIFNAAFTATGGAVGDAKTLTLGGTSTVDNIINGAIPNNAAGGTVNLTKADVGTWVLAGANTYSGATTITNGTLKLKASAAASDIVKEAASNTIVFNANATTGSAGGTLQFTGVSGAATTETLGALTPTAGAGRVTITSGGGGAAANLIFTSLGTVAKTSGVNFITTGGGGGSVTITGLASATATVLPGSGHLYFNGADFVESTAGVLGAPTYTAAGAIFTTAPTALTSAKHNLLTGTYSQAAVTVSSLKIASAQTLTLSGKLTINQGANTDGNILVSGGVSTAISGSGLISTAGSGAIVIRTDATGDTLQLNTNIQSDTTGGLTKNGAGTLIINAVNAQTGATTINEGTVKLLGTGRLSATSIATVIRQGAVLDLNGLSSGVAIGALDGAGTIRSSTGSGTLVVGNITTGAGTFSGIMEDGGGVLNVSVTGTTGAPVWSGLNTYTGVTTIGTGLATTAKLVSVNTLSNIGTASSIGKGLSTNDTTNAASLVFGGLATAGINYTGTTSVSIDRLFTLNASMAGGGGQIANASANNSTLIFNKTNAIAFGAGATVGQTLTLGGASTGDSLINLQIVDNSALRTSLSKIGVGNWFLGNASNSYTGTTTITAGVLGAISGTTLPTNSPLVFAGGQLLTSGNFTRNLVGSVTPGNANEVNWSAGGGFSAGDGGKLVVAIGGTGSPTALTWASGGFVTSGNLILNSATALNEVEFRNAIDLNGAVRTIQVDDNTSTFTDFATITGVISGTGGISKTGTGMLQLLGANTYTGSTAVTAGTLVVTSLGDSAVAGSSSVGTTTGGNTLAQAVILGNATTTAGTLVYVGTGEISDRYIQFNGTTAGPVIVADGSGALVLTNVNNNTAVSPTGAKTLTLRGANTLGNMITSVLSNDGGGGVLSVTHDSAGTWILSGNNTYTGGTTVSAGALGAGHDNAFGGVGTLTINNGAVFAYGGDRTLANPITQSATSSTIASFIGDYSLALTGLWSDPSTTSSGRIIRNNIVSGKTLTLGGEYRATVGTTSRFITFDGSGDTILSGPFTVVSNLDFGLVYAGTGSLTLSNTGNSYTGRTTVSSGTLRLGANEVIPNAMFLR